MTLRMATTHPRMKKKAVVERLYQPPSRVEFAETSRWRVNYCMHNMGPPTWILGQFLVCFLRSLVE